jgi:hypothetical protein
MERPPVLWFLAACGLLVLSTGLLTAAEFVPLGFGVNSNVSVDLLSVSEDDSVVVGGLGEAYRWTRETGAEALLGVTKGLVSGDSLTIVGHRLVSEFDWEPVRITNEGVEVQPIPFGYDRATVRQISQDATTVLGAVQVDEPVRDYALVRWTEEGTLRLADW